MRISIKALILFFSTFVFSQEQKPIAVQADFFNIAADDYVGFDQFGYYYFLRNNALIKTKGKGTVEYKNVSGGKITRVDIENPLLVVVFYEQFNTVVLLDNQLNEVRRINFNESEKLVGVNTQIVVHAVGLASQNRLWIYDSLTQQIAQFDYLTNEYRTISTPLPEPPIYYQTDFNTFRWTDRKAIEYASDIFGKIRTLGSIPQNDGFQFTGNSHYFYVKEGKICIGDFRKNTVSEVVQTDKSFKKFYYKDQILSIFTDEGITNYKITLP
jgi:hypothetical protein